MSPSYSGYKFINYRTVVKSQDLTSSCTTAYSNDHLCDLSSIGNVNTARPGIRGQIVNLKTLLLAVLLLSSCQTTQSDDPTSLSFKIPKGSTVSLNKDLDIPDSKTHATLQNGNITTDREKDDYRLNCRFDVKKFGPHTVKPEIFKIRRSESGQDWISQAAGLLRNYTDVFLDSDKGTDVIKLSCQEQGYKMDRTFTISEMETALGEYFTFTFPQSKPAK